MSCLSAQVVPHGRTCLHYSAQPLTTLSQPLFPPAAEPQGSQWQELRAFQVFPEHAHGTGHAHNSECTRDLLDPQDYVRTCSFSSCHSSGLILGQRRTCCARSALWPGHNSKQKMLLIRTRHLLTSSWLIRIIQVASLHPLCPART